MSIDLKYTVHIGRPVEAVSTAITDLKNMGNWFSIKEVKNVSDGPLQVGTSFQVVSEFVGQDQIIDYQVTEFEPNRSFAYQSDGNFPSMIEMTLEPVDCGTRMVFKFQLRVNRLISAAMRGVIREQLSGDLARLASQLEAEG
jgi:uncharacterized protein YndB with AHSA1/START domain